MSGEAPAKPQGATSAGAAPTLAVSSSGGVLGNVRNAEVPRPADGAKLRFMAPRSKVPPLVRLPPDEEAHVRAGIEAAERSETRALTREELDRWVETGELPELTGECRDASRTSAS